MSRLTTSYVLLSLALSAFAGQRELLTNGGFEEGLAGWQPDTGHELVRDRKAAHTGEACLTGEVTQPKQALQLKRSVKVQGGNNYVFTAWARATNRTKLVLWAVLPGAKNRSMVASWPRVPARWTRYSVPITITQSGTFELHVIAPSSHGEPAGRIWLDDLSLVETPMPRLSDVSKDRGFNDEPAMARAADGTLVVAWLSYRDGGDSLQVARYRPKGKEFELLGENQVVGGKGTYLLGVRAVPAGDAVAVLYAAEREQNWDVHAALVGPNGPGKPIAVTSHAAVDAKPAAAWHDGTLWVAWETNRAVSRQILLASVRGGKVSKPEAVSGTEASDYAPSVAAMPNGEVCVAWHTFREHNYDIFLRRRAPSGTWGKERRVTRAPSIDRHPVLAARQDDLWLLYENANTERYNYGRTNRRRLIVARVTPSGLQAPKGYAGSPLYGRRCEAGQPVFDASGRLWVAYLQPRLPRAGWDVFLTACAGGQWTQPDSVSGPREAPKGRLASMLGSWRKPSPLSARKGMDRRPSLVVDGARAYIALQADTVPNSWSTVDKTPSAKSNIYLASLDLSDAPTGGVPELEPLAEPAEPFEPGTVRVERGEDSPTPSITYKGQTLKLYYGDLHEHTDVSVCNRVGDQSIDESYQAMRDVGRLDFACVTDHGYNITPYLWGYTGKLARVNDDPGRYLTFLGEEWTSSFEKYSEKHPYGYYGHRNLVFEDTYFPRWWNSRDGQTPAALWEELRKMNASFVQIPHQIADTGNVPTDWDFTDEVAQPVAEIFQTRGSYEYRGAPREAKRTTPKGAYFIQDAWARGIVIGVIASPDHGGGYGKACIYATDLSRKAILDALRARRCFGTTAARMMLDVRVAGHLMGEKVAAPAGRAVEVNVTARCPGDIDRIEVCRSNTFIYTATPEGKTASFTFTDRSPLPGRSYYYVRVLQEDGEIGWSSPVWLGAE
jgi:hypothetical protein